MRQTNIFRTTKRDHHIPREVMIKALRLSPGKDWTDHKTDAFQYLKEWALNEDVKKDKGVPMRTGGVVPQVDGNIIPTEVLNAAYKLTPGIDPMRVADKRTKAYKYIKAWINGQTN